MTGTRKSTAQKSGALALVLGLLLCGGASAAPFLLTAQLTGDPRAANPDNLIIDVTVTGDDTLATVKWTVDINSPLHPNAKLDAFYANLKIDPLAGESVFFSNFNPAGWDADGPIVNAPGGGGIDFDFGVSGAAGSTDVTNSQSLTFDMTYRLNGIDSPFNPAILTGAAFSCSNDAILGCGQLGAHLQSLTAGPNQSDSGFLLGDWRFPPQQVPEPGSLALLGVALLGLAGFRRCRKS